MAKNILLTSERNSSLRYDVKSIAKSVKLMHYLLTSPEIGFKRVSFEYFFEKSKSVDLYVHEVDLPIEMDGPAHFFSNTGDPRPTL